MENHKRVLGILFIVLASLQTLAMLLIALLMNTIFSFALSQAEPADTEVLQLILNLASYIPAVIIIFLALPGLIAGIGLLTKQSWAMTFALIIGCLHLLSFPFGTALGVYTIWIYSEDQRLSKINPVHS